MANLLRLRADLCTDRNNFCQQCFDGKTTAVNQCPPNVFRAEPIDVVKPISFIFDKPNDNTPFRNSPFIPITVFDDRAGVIPGLSRAASHTNLLRMCRKVGIIEAHSDELRSPLVHITNAVKCDVSSETGKTGRIKLPTTQVYTCTKQFLARELDIVKSQALVFFGVNAQQYVLNKQTPLWQPLQGEFAGREYLVMRVPHTSPQSFNTYGLQGDAYLEPFAQIRAHVGGNWR